MDRKARTAFRQRRIAQVTKHKRSINAAQLNPKPKTPNPKPNAAQRLPKLALHRRANVRAGARRPQLRAYELDGDDTKPTEAVSKRV